MQPGHEPPQSAPVSLPFFTKSEHVGVWQRPFLHTPLVQSEAPMQILPALHDGHEPPQSASVSVPFLTVSLQVAT
jgi:hypothetical protein